MRTCIKVASFASSTSPAGCCCLGWCAPWALWLAPIAAGLLLLDGPGCYILPQAVQSAFDPATNREHSRTKNALFCLDTRPDEILVFSSPVRQKKTTRMGRLQLVLRKATVFGGTKWS